MDPIYQEHKGVIVLHLIGFKQNSLDLCIAVKHFHRSEGLRSDRSFATKQQWKELLEEIKTSPTFEVYEDLTFIKNDADRVSSYWALGR